LASVIKDLDSVSTPIRYVDQSVVGTNEGMNGGELPRRRAKGIAVPEIVVVIRKFAVCTPMPEILPSVAIVDDDSTIPVTVCKIGFIGVRVYPNTGRAAQKIGVITSTIVIVSTYGHDELAIPRKLHHSMMPVRAHPNEVVVVYEQPMGISRKLRHILRRRVAPPLNDVTRRVKLDNNRGWHAARTDGRFLNESGLFRCERFGQVGDPDVVFGVHEDGRHSTQDPRIGHFLRPRGVDLKRWCLRLTTGWRYISRVGLWIASGQRGGDKDYRGNGEEPLRVWHGLLIDR
tara:strand:- start:124 stop:987 length:864 start_codon:yes stop_codon:yes gene_type:complete